MRKLRKSNENQPLDQATLELLGQAVANVDIAFETRARLRDRVMSRVSEECEALPSFLTIRHSDGPWLEVAPLVEKKVLFVDATNGTESYLLRLHPGAEPEQHDHDGDEICIVLEGDVSFDNIHLKVGDFHFARRGTRHGRASTVNGALLFLQSGLPASQFSI